MNRKKIDQMINDVKKQREQNKLPEETGLLDLKDYIEQHRTTLPDDPEAMFLRLTDGFLNGEFGIRISRFKHEDNSELLIMTTPNYILLRESNRFLRLTDNLKTVLLLGNHILGPGNIKQCIRCIIEFISDEPIIRELIRAKADHIECWLLMNLVNCHFDNNELNDLYKAARITDMPTSYLGRLTNRIHEGNCVLVNEDFIGCVGSTAHNYTLLLTHKTIGLIVNPYQYREAC